MVAFTLSLLPILLIFILMVVFHFGAAKASLCGYLLCLLIGGIFFGGNKWVFYYSHIKGFWNGLDVLLIIWAAFIFYLIVEKAGTIEQIGQILPSLSPSKDIQALLVGWVFASFLQGVGGFGVPVAVVAPLLVSLEFSPMQAVLIPSIGHGWAVTFGSLGSSFRALIAVTAQTPQPLGVASAILLGASAILCGFIVLYLVNGWQSIQSNWLLSLILGISMGGILVYLVGQGLWNLASFLAATGGLILAMLLIYFRNQPQKIHLEIFKRMAFAFSGYFILVVVVILVQIISHWQGVLQSFSIYSNLPAFQTSLGLLGLPVRKVEMEKVGNINLLHPGMVLFYACILTFGFYWVLRKIQVGSITRILRDAIKPLVPTTICVWSMATMAALMESCGMTELIANSIAKLIPQGYALIAPWLGAIGAFITGSNTNSNLLFGLLQTHISSNIGLPIFWILAGQTAGASLGSVLAPAKIIVGTSTSGLMGKEGEVLKKLLPFVTLEVLLISMFVYLATQYLN